MNPKKITKAQKVLATPIKKTPIKIKTNVIIIISHTSYHTTLTSYTQQTRNIINQNIKVLFTRIFCNRSFVRKIKSIFFIFS
jgi:hypothetical protein